MVVPSHAFASSAPASQNVSEQKMWNDPIHFEEDALHTNRTRWPPYGC